MDARKPKMPMRTDENPDDAERDQPVRVVTELLPEEVRWFYKKSASEKNWFALNGHDSLSIEMAFRRHREILQANKCADAPVPCPTEPEETAQVRDWSETAAALGGLYGICYEPWDTSAKATSSASQSPSSDGSTSSDTTIHSPKMHQRFPYRLKSIYWEGSRMHLARGTWFLEVETGNWQPLEGSSPQLAERVEEQHQRMFANQVIPNTPTPQKTPHGRVIGEVKDAEEERNPGHGALVQWFTMDNVQLFNHGHRSRVWRYLQLSTVGTKLVRAYHTAARLDDGPPPVTDLVFVVHGIGQRFVRKKIIDDANGMREICEELLKGRVGASGASKALFLPVDWRTELKFNEQIILSLTPKYLEHVRAFFNESLMDLMYYASPVHGAKLTRGLSTVLNRLYRTFLVHEPGFVSRKGRVSLAAHSLGAVIAYDLLTVESSADGATPSDDRVSIISRTDAQTSRLMFSVDHMFCVGSPLAVFLAAREIRGKRILHPPAGSNDFRLHNIYHPADAVAYRLEPLVVESYSNVVPLLLHSYDAKDQPPYDLMPMEKYSTLKPTTSSSSPIVTLNVSNTSPIEIPDAYDQKQPLPPPSPTGSHSLEEKRESSSRSEEKGKDNQEDELLPYRIDYELAPGRIISAYWAAITSHGSYWTNWDVINYIVTALSDRGKRK